MSVVGASEMIEIRAERPHHAENIERLLDTVFGEGRRSKAVYSLRNGVSPIEELCHVALVDGELHGAIRFWPIQAVSPGTQRRIQLLLLGPLAVDPVFQGAGIGRALVEYSLILAGWRGHRAAVLVGDPAYYSRFHFDRAGARELKLPGEADQERLLLREIVRGAAADCQGTLVSASAEIPELCQG
ncbi:MAG: GNAT family N-acetyltransferase [Alphaproteobacteria bacterium]|nr:GNAT family N-acetyltransferase [Alphaproteobacteria bacterium]